MRQGVKRSRGSRPRGEDGGLHQVDVTWATCEKREPQRRGGPEVGRGAASCRPFAQEMYVGIEVLDALKVHS